MNPQSIPLGTQAEAVQIVTQDDLALIFGDVAHKRSIVDFESLEKKALRKISL